MPDDDDGLSQEAVDGALGQATRAAFALAGLSAALLLIGWLAIYFFIFLPRGPVG